MDLQQLAPWGGWVIGAASLIYTYVSNRRDANSEQVNRIETKVGRAEADLDKLDKRITIIDSEMKHLPDRRTTHALELAIAQLSSKVDVVNASLKPIIAMADRVQENLLERLNP